MKKQAFWPFKDPYRFTVGGALHTFANPLASAQPRLEQWIPPPFKHSLAGRTAFRAAAVGSFYLSLTLLARHLMARRQARAEAVKDEAVRASELEAVAPKFSPDPDLQDAAQELAEQRAGLLESTGPQLDKKAGSAAFVHMLLPILAAGGAVYAGTRGYDDRADEVREKALDKQLAELRNELDALNYRRLQLARGGLEATPKMLDIAGQTERKPIAAPAAPFELAEPPGMAKAAAPKLPKAVVKNLPFWKSKGLWGWTLGGAATYGGYRYLARPSEGFWAGLQGILGLLMAGSAGIAGISAYKMLAKADPNRRKAKALAVAMEELRRLRVKRDLVDVAPIDPGLQAELDKHLAGKGQAGLPAEVPTLSAMPVTPAGF